MCDDVWHVKWYAKCSLFTPVFTAVTGNLSKKETIWSDATHGFFTTNCAWTYFNCEAHDLAMAVLFLYSIVDVYLVQVVMLHNSCVSCYSFANQNNVWFSQIIFNNTTTDCTKSRLTHCICQCNLFKQIWSNELIKINLNRVSISTVCVCKSSANKCFYQVLAGVCQKCTDWGSKHAVPCRTPQNTECCHRPAR